MQDLRRFGHSTAFGLGASSGTGLAILLLITAMTGCSGTDLRDLESWLHPEASSPLEPSIPLGRVEEAMLAEMNASQELWASGWTGSRVRDHLLAREFGVLENRLGEIQRRFEDGELLETTAWAAFAAFRRNDPEIRDALDEWVAHSPDSWVALYARGAHLTKAGIAARGVQYIRDTEPSRIQTMRELLASAAVDLERACELRPKWTACWDDLLEIHKYMGNAQGVEECARRAIQEVPSTVNVRRSWVQARQPNWGGSHAEMRAIARDALEHVDENAMHHLLGGFEHSQRADDAWNRTGCKASIEHWRKALEFGPNPRWNRELGRALWCSGDPEGAVSVLTEAIRFEPWHARAYSFRGRSYQGLGRNDLALADFDSVLEIDPRDATVHELRGRALAALGRIDEAHAALEDALEIDPRRWGPWELKGMIEGDLRGDWAAAKESYRHLAELSPDQPESLWNVMIAHWHTNDPDVVPAVERYLEVARHHEASQASQIAWAREFLAQRERETRTEGAR